MGLGRTSRSRMSFTIINWCPGGPCDPCQRCEWNELHTRQVTATYLNADITYVNSQAVKIVSHFNVPVNSQGSDPNLGYCVPNMIVDLTTFYSPGIWSLDIQSLGAVNETNGS